MDRVWILSLGMDYEGEEVLGVFDTEAGALASAARYVESRPNWKPAMKRSHQRRWLYRTDYEYLRVECCIVTREP